MQDLKSKHGISSIFDIILNQISPCSEWLNENPDAAFNLKNSPHLGSALALDEALIEWSDENSSESIKTEVDL